MRKLLLIAPLLLSGCGLKMIKKNDAQAAVAKVYGQLDELKGQVCSPENDAKLDAIKTGLDAFITAYLK